MPILADRKYRCEIIRAELYRSAIQQTPGLQLHLECGEGSISHTLWLSPKAKVGTEKKLCEIGVTDAEMKSCPFWESVALYLIGKRVRIETEEEVYMGKTRVRVKWLNADTDLADGAEDLAAYAAQFFGGKSSTPLLREPAPANEPPPPSDEDVPF